MHWTLSLESFELLVSMALSIELSFSDLFILTEVCYFLPNGECFCCEGEMLWWFATSSGVVSFFLGMISLALGMRSATLGT